jgi:adenosylcobinamide amidohydrolase
MLLYTLPTGDPVERCAKILVVKFVQQRKVLSTSVLNGGYRQDLTAVFNNEITSDANKVCLLRAPTYEGHLRLEAESIGLDPDTVSGMGTAVLMENAAIAVERYEALTVTAIATGGIEVNGGRVGDPATYFQPVENGMRHKPGTINILLVIDADMPPGSLVRSLVTCTEAKTAALQELMAGSNYSNGLATGSGTDETIVIANPGSSLYQVSAGKHCKLGELIGRAVRAAVKEALERHTGLSPLRQHSVLRRLKRFGVNEETLWQRYAASNDLQIDKQRFDLGVRLSDRDQRLITYTSLYIHLLDQFIWGLLSGTEIRQAGNELISLVAGQFAVSPVMIAGPDLEGWIRAWEDLIIKVAVIKSS